MKVSDLMTQGALTCHPDDHLAEAAKLMWSGDCGMIPVLEDGRLRGVITDRDICMAVAMQGQLAEEIPVDRVMNPKPHTCLPTAKVQTALEVMKKYRVRRLPVVGRDGEFEGVLSMNDLILEAKARGNKVGAPTHAEVIGALRQIGQHRELPAVV